MKISKLVVGDKLKQLFLALVIVCVSFASGQNAATAKTQDLVRTNNIGSGTTSGLFMAANLALSSRDYKGAADYLMQLYINSPDDLIFIESLFIVHLINGDLALAEAFAKLYHKKNIDNDEAKTSHYFLSKLFLTLVQVEDGDYKAAINDLEKGDDFIISEMSFYLLSAWINYAQDKPLNTADSLNMLQENSFHRIYYLINSAIFAQLQGRDDAANDFYIQALAMGGTKLDLIEAYGRFLERAGRTDQAFELYDDFINRAGNHPVITNALARLKTGVKPAALIGNTRQAIAYSLYHIANIYYGAGNYDESINYARLAQYLDPESNYILNILSLNFQNVEKYVYSNVELAKIKPNSPFYFRSQIRIAANLEINGQKELALKKIAALLTHKKVDDTVYLAYANMLKRNQKYEQSLVYYDKLIGNLSELTINEADLFFHRAVSFERLNDWSKAEQDFEQALELDPNHSSALNYLGYMWVDKGIRLAEGLEMINTALLIEPQNAFIIDSLGWAYYKSGEFEQAAIELERALLYSPSSADISDHLGDAYWRLGRELEAEFKWQQATIFKSPEINYEDLAYKREHGLDSLLAQKKLAQKAQKKTKKSALTDTPNMGQVTVGEGESLWDISYRIYGNGDYYDAIYQANKDILRTPEVITPGQVLILPKYLKTQ